MIEVKRPPPSHRLDKGLARKPRRHADGKLYDKLYFDYVADDGTVVSTGNWEFVEITE